MFKINIEKAQKNIESITGNGILHFYKRNKFQYKGYDSNEYIAININNKHAMLTARHLGINGRVDSSWLDYIHLDEYYTEDNQCFTDFIINIELNKNTEKIKNIIVIDTFEKINNLFDKINAKRKILGLKTYEFYDREYEFFITELISGTPDIGFVFDGELINNKVNSNIYSCYKEFNNLEEMAYLFNSTNINEEDIPNTIYVLAIDYWDHKNTDVRKAHGINKEAV